MYLIRMFSVPRYRHCMVRSLKYQVQDMFFFKPFSYSEPEHSCNAVYSVCFTFHLHLLTKHDIKYTVNTASVSNMYR
jgi:hypothetical protein